MPKVANLNVEVGRIVKVRSSNDPNIMVGETFMVTNDVITPLISLEGKYKGTGLTSRYISYAERKLCLKFE